MEQLSILDFLDEKQKPKVNSFFCGAGGFDWGFIQAGFEIAGAWDFDKYAVQSYKHNIGDHVQQADVTQMKGSDIPKADGWLFGFPCQDISVAGKQAGMIKGETRSGLFYEIMRLLDEVDEKPEWILAENVKAVKKFIPTIEEEYDKAGYTLVNPQLYNSKYWGVPQNRERYFLLGIRKDLNKSFIFPEQQTAFIPKLSSILEENVGDKYYITDEKAKAIIDKAVEKIGEINVIGHLDKPNWKAQWKRIYDTDGLSPTLVGSGGGHHEPKILEYLQDVFTDKDGAAYCCDANYHKGINEWYVGRGQRTHIFEPGYRVRKLTPREYARLQGFPDSYEFVVSNSQLYKQFGNAVTTNVAHAIATAIKEQLS